jgi:hypothetical protein
MISRRGAKLGSLCVLMFGLGGACTVERNLPLGDWPEAGAGGSAGSGGSTTGGSGSSAGSGGGASTGSGGEFLGVGCDYVTVLKTNCARAGCHNARTAVAGLDLTPTPAAGLVARLKDQPASHAQIDCGNGDPYFECVPASCPAPGSALLVDSANPDDSWILRKLTGTHNDCGSQMPMAPVLMASTRTAWPALSSSFAPSPRATAADPVPRVTPPRTRPTRRARESKLAVPAAARTSTVWSPKPGTTWG